MANPDPKVYGDDGGHSAEMHKRPREIKESSHTHRAVRDLTCYDCRNRILKGAVYTASMLSMTHGYKGQSFTYEVHPECYAMSQEMTMVLGGGFITGVGRKPLWQSWYDNQNAVIVDAPMFAAKLKRAFGMREGR